MKNAESIMAAFLDCCLVKIKKFQSDSSISAFQKQVGLIACPIYCVVMLSASQEDKYRDEIK